MQANYFCLFMLNFLILHCQKKRLIMKHSLNRWVIATRPWSFPASAMPVLTTIFWLWSRGIDVCWWLGLFSVLNIIIVHAAGNVWSDIADYQKGVDAEDTFCVRTLLDGEFTVAEFKRLSIGLNIVAILMGLYVVWMTGPLLLLIGIAGVALSLCYPYLKYMALGDLVIILCYAFLPMIGTSYIVSGYIFWDVLWLSVPVGLITVAILHSNNTRDIATDRRAGIKTFAMIMGRSFSVWLYVFEVLFPFVWLLGLMIFGIASWWLLTAMLALPVAIKNVRTILSCQDMNSIESASLDEKTAQLQLLFSLLLVIGMVLSVYI